MELKEKEFIKLKFGLCIQNLIYNNTNSITKNFKGDTTISSLRKLAASSSLEYAIIQKITSGKKNPELTTLVSIANGFNISLSELIQNFDRIIDEDVMDYRDLLKKAKQERDKKKLAAKKKANKTQ